MNIVCRKEQIAPTAATSSSRGPPPCEPSRSEVPPNRTLIYSKYSGSIKEIRPKFTRDKKVWWGRYLKIDVILQAHIPVVEEGADLVHKKYVVPDQHS